jgi:hypothetical protein
MLDTMIQRRPGFRLGASLHLADGQEWTVPAPGYLAESGQTYDALVAAVCLADDRPEMLRAELALGIHLLALNYSLEPLLMGALLDFPKGDPALDRLQAELHTVAVDHVRAHRSMSDDSIAPQPTLRIPRGFGFLHRARATMSA